MKNKLLIFITFSAIVALTACWDNGTDTKYFIRLSDVYETVIIDSVLQNTKINFTVKHTGYSGCDTYSHHALTQDSNKYYFEIYVKRPDGAICTMELIQIETNISIIFKQKGLNYLYFKQHDNNYLTDSVYVF